MVKKAFDHCVADYARYRPTYPDGVFDILAAAHRGSRPGPVADIGAGTGIFTRRLASAGWRVVAVEPSAAMLRHVRAGESDRVRALCATAEATGLADRSVSMVTAAQSFHWFNPPWALAEFGRILRPGGVLALCWNNRDRRRSSFVAAYESLIARYNSTYDREYRRQDWTAKIRTSGLFEPAQRHRVDHVWRLSADAMVGFSRSVSYIRNVLPRARMARFEDDLRGLIRDHFSDDECHIPLRTDLWTTRRRKIRADLHER